jgi:hypothetical protein
MYHLVNIYILNTKFECTFKYKVSYFSFVKKSIEVVAKGVHPPRAVLLAWLSPLLGRKRVAEIYYRRWCRMLQNSAK